MSYKRNDLDIDSRPPEPPAELLLLNRLTAWQALPWEGGYLDQPYTLMQDLDTVKNAQAVHQRNIEVQADTQDHFDSLLARAKAMAAGG